MKTKQEFEAQWPTLMADVPCGFYCPKGWSELVWTLLVDIDALLDGDFTGTGDSDGFKIAQVKEKFGGLRFYYSYDIKGATKEAIKDLVLSAEMASNLTCLSCGTTAGVTTGVTGGGPGWISSECRACRQAPVSPRTPRHA